VTPATLHEPPDGIADLAGPELTTTEKATLARDPISDQASATFTTQRQLIGADHSVVIVRNPSFATGTLDVVVLSGLPEDSPFKMRSWPSLLSWSSSTTTMGNADDTHFCTHGFSSKQPACSQTLVESGGSGTKYDAGERAPPTNDAPRKAVDRDRFESVV
jgi:hypothetical protein